MMHDDYKHEIESLKSDRAVLLHLMERGRSLMRELAKASDGAVLTGEVFPEDLNARIGAWLHANLTDPLPPTHRSVDAKLMHWAGIPVFVSGIVSTAPENWQLIATHDAQPRSGSHNEQSRGQ